MSPSGHTECTICSFGYWKPFLPSAPSLDPGRGWFQPPCLPLGVLPGRPSQRDCSGISDSDSESSFRTCPLLLSGQKEPVPSLRPESGCYDQAAESSFFSALTFQRARRGLFFPGAFVRQVGWEQKKHLESAQGMPNKTEDTWSGLHSCPRSRKSVSG